LRTIFLSLLLVGLVIYANTLSHPFVHDDLVFIRHNPEIHRLDHWPALFLKAADPVPGIKVANPYYRPLLEILYRVQYRILGFKAWGYHLFNILLHVLNAWLVFLIVERGLGRLRTGFPSFLLPVRGLSWGTAMLFLTHPVQSEAVACIAGISNLTVAFFVLLSLYLIVRLRFSDSGPAEKRLCLAGAYVFYLAALLTKEQAIFLPLALIALEVAFFLSRRGRLPDVITPMTVAIPGQEPPLDRRVVPAGISYLGGFLIITLLYLIWRKCLTGQITTVILAYPGELLLRLKAIGPTLLIYGRILILPMDLHYMRSLDILAPFGLAWSLLLVVALLSWLVIRRMPAIASAAATAAWMWFFIALLPMLNLVPLIHEYSWIAIFEHFLYLPSAGFFLFVLIAADFGLGRIARDQSKRILTLVVIVSVAVFGGLTFRQNAFWRNEVALFERAVRYEPHLGRLRFLLGRSYFFQGNMEAADRELASAVDIMRDYLKKSRGPQARRFYEYFIREIYFVMAHVREQKQEYRQANALYRQALNYVPDDARLYKSIGVNLVRLRDWDGAISHFRRALRQDPDDSGILNNLAVCLIETGQTDEARGLLLKAVAADGHFGPARRNLDRLDQGKAGDSG